MTHQCPACGRLFGELREDRTIPCHDHPPPCRSLCRGSGEYPRDPSLGDDILDKHGEPRGGNLLVGVTELGEVVLDLGTDLTGHINFTPRQARMLADLLNHKASEAEQERTINV